ncbi:hypothetical protein [Leucobacter aridicollis]|uniref:hypothetical protein n=1 Tax=Leucobacter aridicollis TaxID=283878 RepID=UPI002169FA4D|nr:hypothetical protein [Leucobacter aridicollis]MCS3426725.1 hypothetical protein [Leucobacter aridicollis]
MTARDVRTAAQAEAERRHRLNPDHMRARVFFVEGAVWGAALVSEGIRLTDFRGDGVYRDAGGMIWQRVEDTRKAVEIAIATATARVTPTREQIAQVLADLEPPYGGVDFYEGADAVLALIEGAAAG